jgi:hypothetical protein
MATATFRMAFSDPAPMAVLVSIIAITISVFCKEPFLVLLESFIPYPELPRLF